MWFDSTAAHHFALIAQWRVQDSSKILILVRFQVSAPSCYTEYGHDSLPNELSAVACFSDVATGCGLQSGNGGANIGVGDAAAWFVLKVALADRVSFPLLLPANHEIIKQ